MPPQSTTTMLNAPRRPPSPAPVSIFRTLQLLPVPLERPIRLGVLTSRAPQDTCAGTIVSGGLTLPLIMRSPLDPASPDGAGTCSVSTFERRLSQSRLHSELIDSMDLTSLWSFSTAMTMETSALRPPPRPAPLAGRGRLSVSAGLRRSSLPLSSTPRRRLVRLSLGSEGNVLARRSISLSFNYLFFRFRPTVISSCIIGIHLLSHLFTPFPHSLPVIATPPGFLQLCTSTTLNKASAQIKCGLDGALEAKRVCYCKLGEASRVDWGLPLSLCYIEDFSVDPVSLTFGI